jgi:two-component system, response regulator FlrC
MSRILVAEDDPHILRLIAMWLRRQGHEVLEARHGAAARDLMRAQAVDVLISDVNMPGLDGVELIESVLPQGRVRRGVIVLTNRWDHGEIRERLARWGVQVMPKPFSPTRLSELVESLARSETANPECVAGRPGADAQPLASEAGEPAA